LQKKLILSHQNEFVTGTGVNTAFLTTEKIDELMVKELRGHLGGTVASAKQLLDVHILTKSLTHPSGLAPNKTRVFVRRVLPRWEEKLISMMMEGFGEQACLLLNTGKATGEGTRGDIPQLESAGALICLKDNWFFTTVNGRKCVLFEAKHAFAKLGCLSSVYVSATADEAAYFKMRTALYARIVFSVCFCPGPTHLFRRCSSFPFPL